MKFLHTADVHWGAVPDGDKPWSRERAQAIRDTFSRIVDMARERETDLLLISGDLFHRQPIQKDLKDLNYLFSTIPSVHVVIIAGSSDRIRSNSAIHSFQWAPNVSYLADGHLQSVYFPDCNVEVHGISCCSPEPQDALPPDILEVPFDGRIHILMLHGGDSDRVRFDRSAIASSNYSYVALGHLHKPELAADLKSACPGSPEPLDCSETGPHGIYAGSINPVTRKVESLDFVPLCRSQYIQLIVNITPHTTASELEFRISQEIRRRGEQNIYRFRIRGRRDPAAEFDLRALTSRYRILEITDESEPLYDFSALYAEHPGDMIGFYIRAFDKPDPSPVEKKALYYGINALLRTADERS